MKKPFLFFALFGTLQVFACYFMYGQKSQWYKGNLHTHSYWSDGDNFPEMILDWYKSHDYDFVALSEHNIIADHERWINLRKRRHGQASFQAYLEKFGTPWVSYKIEEGDTLVQLKTADIYRPRFEVPGEFLIIPSEEITDRYQDKPVHLNATNIQSLIEPQGGKTMTEVMQRNISAVLAQREQTGIPMIPHINHPNFGWAMTAEDMIGLNGERFFEVYNGHPAVNNYGDDQRSGTEEMWDEILEAYIRMGKPLMYGLAVDDAHNYHEQGLAFSNPGRGWVMVKAASLSPESIIAALEAGDFYGSSGVTIQEIQENEKKLSLRIKGEKGVTYETWFIGATGKKSGVVFEKVAGTHPSYTFTGDELYVRAKVVSSRPKENPYKTGEFESAWTQPVIPAK